MKLLEAFRKWRTPNHMKVQPSEVWVFKENPKLWVLVRSVRDKGFGVYLTFEKTNIPRLREDYLELELFLFGFELDKQRTKIAKVLYG